MANKNDDTENQTEVIEMKTEKENVSNNIKITVNDDHKRNNLSEDAGNAQDKTEVEVKEGFIVEDGMVYDDSDWEQDDSDGTNRTDSKNDQKDEKSNENFIGKVVLTGQHSAFTLWQNLNAVTKGYLLPVILVLGYIAYLIAAMIHERLGGEGSIRLLAGTILAVIVKTRQFWIAGIESCFGRLIDKDSDKVKKIRKVIRWFIYFCLLAFVAYILVLQGQQDVRNLRPVPGLICMMFFCLIISKAPSQINWHTVYWSVGLQLMCSVFVLKIEFGQNTMQWIQFRFDEYFNNTGVGSLALFGETYRDHYPVFGAFPMILYSNATLSLLYHVGAIQLIIKSIGTVLQFILDTSPIESTAVAGGIFLEGVMSLLSVKPFLGRVTQSQLFLITTSVFSSLGGAYIGMLSALGVKVIDIIPAMLMSAPATFTICKILVPEIKQGKEIEIDSVAEKGKRKQSIVEIFQTGATQMIPLIGNIVAIIFVFNSFMSWINHTLIWFGDRVGIDEFTLPLVFSYLLYPVAFAMGVETDDCKRAAALLGYRISSSNLIAFQQLTKMNDNRHKFNAYMDSTNFTGTYSRYRDDIIIANETLPLGFMNERSEKMITYTLCGFSSIVSVCFNMGVISTLIPRRKKWLTSNILLALIAGNLANCMTGAFAGLFYYK